MMLTASDITDNWWHLTPTDLQIVIVHWRDICESSQWSGENVNEIRPVHIATMGWLLYEGEDPWEMGQRITVIGKSYDYNDRRWADLTIFPHNVIRRTETVCTDTEN